VPNTGGGYRKKFDSYNELSSKALRLARKEKSDKKED
jgi:hypothetical protein